MPAPISHTSVFETESCQHGGRTVANSPAALSNVNVSSANETETLGVTSHTLNMLTSCPPHVCPSVNCVFNQRTRVTPWLCLSYDFLSLHESEADEPLFTLLTCSGFYYIECMCLCVACVCVCARMDVPDPPLLIQTHWADLHLYSWETRKFGSCSGVGGGCTYCY